MPETPADPDPPLALPRSAVAGVKFTVTGVHVSSVRLQFIPFRAIACCLISYVFMSGCSSPKSEGVPAAATAASVVPATLWGDMKPVVSVKELMKYMIDPIADSIFNAVGSTLTKKGLVEREPKTDDDWEKIRIGAVSLAEGAYLLKVRRPFTPPGDENNSAGPDAVELAPAQITAKVERDPVEWNARIEALRNVALEVIDVVEKRDIAELWDAGENLDKACEACHRSYWYPGESAEFYQGLRKKLEKLHQEQGVARGTSGAPAKH